MKVLWKILKGIITIFLVIVLCLVVFQKVTKNKVAIGDIYIFQIATGSMQPVYKVGDIIVVKKENPANLKKGDDVTYLGQHENFKGLVITHRIMDIREENGKRYFITKGIANILEDPEISEDDIYGKMIYHTVLFSFVGRLMTNPYVYYFLFVAVAISFSYEIISSFIKKEDD